MIGCCNWAKGIGIEVVDFIKDGFGDDIIDNLRNTLLEKMGKDHINFFNNLEISFSNKQYLICTRWNRPLKSCQNRSKVTTYGPDLQIFFIKFSKKIIVHGHTPEKISLITSWHKFDTGDIFQDN